MTDSRAVALPALITTVVSLMISARIEPSSIDTLGLTAEGKSLHPPTELEMIERMPIETVYRRNFDSVSSEMPLGELLGFVRTSRGSTLPVLDVEGALVGLLSFTSLRALLLDQGAQSEGARTAKDVCDTAAAVFRPSDELGWAFRRIDVEGLDDVPVVESATSRRVIGMISRADLIAAHNRSVATIGATDLPRWLRRVDPGGGAEHAVASVSVPPHWIGLTVAQLEERTKALVVLAIHTRTAGYQRPEPGTVVRAGDVVVLAGTREALRSAGSV
jgi:CBS domain-containing protein